jgi:MFS family permease
LQQFKHYLVGNSFISYDIPGALKKQIEDDLNLTGFQQTLLYSVYSIPNTVLPLFGGFFVDRLGTNVTLFTFCTLITLGQFIFALGMLVTRNFLIQRRNHF